MTKPYNTVYILLSFLIGAFNLYFLQTWVVNLIFLFFIPGLLMGYLLHDKSYITFAFNYGFIIWTAIGLLFITIGIPLSLNSIFVSVFIVYILLIIGFNIDNNEKPLFAYKNFLSLSQNHALLYVFLGLLSIYACIRVPFVPVDDNWYHMKVIQDLLSNGVFPDPTEHRGNLTYHFIGAVVCVSSNLEIMVLGRFVGLFQIFYGCILFFNLSKTILKKTNVSIIGTVIYSLTTLGTITTLDQLWPTSLAVLLGFQLTTNFFNYYKSMLNSDSEQKDSRKKISYFLIQTIIMTAIMKTHVSSLIAFIIPYLILSILFLFVKKDFWKDLVYYIVIFLLNLLINPYNLSLIPPLSTSFFGVPLWVIIIIASPVVIWGIRIFAKWFNSITMNGSDTPTFDASNNFIIRFLENGHVKKYFIPVIVVIVPIFYYFVNSSTKRYFPANPVIMAIDLGFTGIIFMVFVIDVYIYRNMESFGKINLGYFFAIFGMLIGLIVLQSVYTLIVRLLILWAPIILLNVVLFLKYILYYSPKMQIKSSRIPKLVFIIFLMISLGYQITLQEHISLSKNNFIESSIYYMEKEGNSSESNIIIGIFHYMYPTRFYADENDTIYNQYYTAYIPIEKHYNNESLIFNSIKENNQTNVYIIIDESYITRGLLLWDGVEYGSLSDAEYNQYCNLEYANRISVVNDKNLYWIKN